MLGPNNAGPYPPPPPERMVSKGTHHTVLMNDRELESVFATGQSVRPEGWTRTDYDS